MLSSHHNPLLPRPTLPPQSMSEFAYSSLRAAILDGTLRGGSRLVIATLAKQLEVSSTPLRDALHDLAHEGLVVMDARRGAEVRVVDLEEVTNLYEIRGIIEPLLSGRAATRITPTELESLNELQKHMSIETDFGRWNQFNDGFHAGLAKAAKWDESLESLTRSLHARGAIHVGLAVNFEFKQHNAEFWRHEISRSAHEHQEILDACTRGDADAASAAMRTHIQATFENIKRLHESTGP